MSGRPLALAAAVAALAASSPSPLDSQAIDFSQYGSVIQRLGDVEITIRYRRPVARGRELFGALVRWDRVWAPGADSATTIAVSGAVEFAGHPLSAGTYSIWMIPRPGDWTVILSRAAHVYHTPYPECQDVLRISVAPAPAPHVETLTFAFPMVDGPAAELAFQWGETELRIPITIAVDP